VNAIVEALQPFDGRYVGLVKRRGEAPRSLMVIGLHDQGTVTLQGPQELVGSAFEHLGEVDVAPPQVTVTVQLVLPGTKGTPLDAGVHEDLKRMTGIESFMARSFAMVRSSVDLETTRSMMLTDSETGHVYTVELRPTAYDHATGAVTFGYCSLTSNSAGMLFQTSATVDDGVTTLIGAAGQEPTFVLLRCATKRVD
jgi:hypothetical protein